jgi:hypothetical protein
MQFRTLVRALGAAAVLLPSAAQAHIQMLKPNPRHPGTDPPLKVGPCGESNETRSKIINVFKPGEMITVSWNEFIPHPGHFRIAFLANGDAFPEPKSFTDIVMPPVLPILADNLYPHTSGNEKMYEMKVQLPNVECTNCTLQLIQMMTDKPPYTVGGNDVYHECADIVLSNSGGDGGAPRPDAGKVDAAAGGTGGAGTGGTGGAGGSGGSGGATGGSGGSGGATGGSGGSAGSGGTGGQAGGTGGTAATGGAGGSAPPPKKDAGGCAIGGSRSGGGALLLLVAVALLQRRRRRTS